MYIIWKSKHGTYNALVSNKQDQTTNTCYYMGESQNHYVKGKKPDTVPISYYMNVKNVKKRLLYGNKKTNQWLSAWNQNWLQISVWNH